MSDEHKAALAEGRSQVRAVRRYLEALESNQPKRGRTQSAESVQKRLDRIASEIESADPLRRLALTQKQSNLGNELAAGDSAVDIASLEESFLAATARYAARKGISYQAF